MKKNNRSVFFRFVPAGFLFFTCGVALAPAQAVDFTIEKNIPFLGTERREKMDAYLPSKKYSRPLPAVIWIHGGGWIGGDKAAEREINICSTLASNGYAAFSINYQLGRKPPAKDSTPLPASNIDSGNPEAPWPQNFYDCKSAVRYIRSQSARFGIDPSRIGISGGSAGGHLSLLTGVTGTNAGMNNGGMYTEQSSSVSCIIDFYGIPDIFEERRIKLFSGKTPEETQANLKAAAATTYLGPDTPPILIVHGTEDTTVNVDVSRKLDRLLTEKGIPHQYIEVPGAKHAFHFQPPEMDLRPAVLEFLGNYLGKPALDPAAISSP